MKRSVVVKQAVARLRPQTDGRAMLVGGLLVALIGLIDYLTGIEVSFSIFFLIPVGYVGWFSTRRNGLWISAASAFAWLMADLMGGHAYSSHFIPFWNAGVRLGFLGTVVLLLSQLRHELISRAGLIRQLRRALSDRRCVAADLSRSNAELEEYAQVVAHDLKSPLVYVGGYLELLERRVGNELDPETKGFIRSSLEGVARIQALVDGILAYSRAGTESRDVEPVDLNEIVEEALVDLRPQVEEARARVTREPLPVVRADRTQMAQLFRNLIGNALKYRRPDTPPSIQVKAASKAGVWLLSIRDNGIGMDPRESGQVFAMHKRLQPDSDVPGMGIGLAVCRKIVERHGGRIWVDSAPGEGATFHFTLPPRS